ncbi:MAG: TonB family protein [Flavobacteriales bacterium]
MDPLYGLLGTLLVFSLLMGIDRSWNNSLSSIRNDLVFAKRNKEYGAFALRRDYTKRLAVALFGSVIIFGFAIAAPKIFAGSGDVAELKQKVVDVDLELFVDEDEPPPPPPPEDIPPPPKVETVQFVQVEATNEEVDDPPPTQLDLDSTLASTETQEGVKEDEAPPPVEEDNTTYGYGMVEENATFPGGEKGLFAYLDKNVQYPAMEQDAGIQGRVFVEFVVDKDGSVLNVALKKGLSPGLDKEALRVVKAMPKWAPAKMGGRPVKQLYRLPILFALE